MQFPVSIIFFILLKPDCERIITDYSRYVEKSMNCRKQIEGGVLPMLAGAALLQPRLPTGLGQFCFPVAYCCGVFRYSQNGLAVDLQGSGAVKFHGDLMAGMDCYHIPAADMGAFENAGEDA